MENKKLKSLDGLLRELESLKKRGSKIVFTNGCFDILHRGHVAYLQETATLGDVLVLGLNSDESVKKLKGRDRPVNNEWDRAYVLGALECVDYIVIFTEDTPHEILSRIRPDVLAKGGDYAAEDVVGREFAGETRLIAFVDGYSTTKIIERMKE